MRKILVIPMYGIGDVLMTTPAIMNLKKQFNAEITYLHMFETTRDILLRNPHIEKHIYFPFLQKSKQDGVRFLMSLRKKYDFSINFYPSNRMSYNLAALIINAPVRIGHRYECSDLRELNFLKNRTIKENDLLHNVEENYRLLSFFGIKEAEPSPMKIYLTEEERLFGLQWLKQRHVGKQILIGVHPGTSIFKNHEKKRWPIASFAGVIDRLSRKISNAAFLVFGGEEEKPLRDRLISLVHSGENIFPAETLSVRESAAVMERCSLFLTNDSGPMHMAAALGIPVVAIFGPTNPIRVRPWAVEHMIVQPDMPCSPCFRYSPKPLQCKAGLDYACISGITQESVSAACLELLAGIS